MKTHLALTALLCTSSLISGCSKQAPTSFAELDTIIEPTETKAEDRTVQWFADQKKIRKDVLGVCFDYFSNKAESLGGNYELEFNDNIYSKYLEIPDCDKARQGEIKTFSSDTTLGFEHQALTLESKILTPEIQAEIDRAAQEVAKHLDEMDKRNHSINKEGDRLINQIAD